MLLQFHSDIRPTLCWTCSKPVKNHMICAFLRLLQGGKNEKKTRVYRTSERCLFVCWLVCLLFWWCCFVCSISLCVWLFVWFVLFALFVVLPACLIACLPAFFLACCHAFSASSVEAKHHFLCFTPIHALWLPIRHCEYEWT